MDFSRQDKFITEGQGLFAELVRVMGDIRVWKARYDALGALVGNASFKLSDGWPAAQGGTGDASVPLRTVPSADFANAVQSIDTLRAAYDAGHATNLNIAKT
jgi:hypothetical protein